jgi:RNA polymerase sigma-70 factor (sigma-E family)
VDIPVNEAFADFVALRYGDLLRTAFLLTGSQHTAEDLVQACLVKAMSRWESIEEPLTYLRRALVNERITWWRRLRRELLRAEPPDVPATGDDIAAIAERAAVLAGLADLPRRMRAVLVLRFWEDLTEADTAELLGCSVGTVKSQTSRGLSRLRAVLESNDSVATDRGRR